MALLTSFSGIANTNLMILADRSSLKCRKRAITLVGSGENMTFFLLIVTGMGLIVKYFLQNVVANINNLRR
jgi:hypothetical protein